MVVLNSRYSEIQSLNDSNIVGVILIL
jgi:hypothetical protein